MRFFIYMIILVFITSFLYAKKIDKESIKVTELEADEDFFNNLQKIRSQIEEKDQKVERKRAEIEELKKELDKRESNIKKYQVSIDKNIKSFSTEKSKKFKMRVLKLNKVFESMKPKNVAKIIENLPDDLVIAVFLKLKEDHIGKIMKYLDPKKSAALSEKLTEWKNRYKLKDKKKKKVSKGNP